MSKTNANNKNGKTFPPQVGFWPAKTDPNKFTVYLDDKVMAQLQKAVAGGRLLLSRTPDERREEFPNIPHWQVTIFPPEQENKKQADDSL